MTYQDGQQIMSAGLQLANVFGAMNERRRDEQRRQSIEGYLARRSRGEKIDPAEQGYNYSDDLAAQAVILRNALADEQFRATKLANDSALAEANQRKINEQIAQAQVYYFKAQQEKDPAFAARLQRQAYDALIPVYEYVPDGGKFVGWKDQERTTMIIEDATGKKSEQPAPPLERALSMAQVVSKDYRDNFLNTRAKIREFNADQVIRAATDETRRQRTADGKEALFIPFVELDDKGGYVMRQSWQDPKNGQVIKGFDPDTGKQVKSNLEFRSTAYWNSVAKLSNEQRKSWEKAVEAADKAWEANIKEGVVDAAAVDENGWKQQYAVSYFRRLRPGAPLPEGLASAAGAGTAPDHWSNYVTGFGGSANDGLMAAHGPGRNGKAGSAAAQQARGIGAVATAQAADAPAAAGLQAVHGQEKAEGFDEQKFLTWYQGWAQKTGIDPDPDHPAHKYDYRAAYRAGVEPTKGKDGKFHWPSRFKADDHPNRYVEGVDTKTGLRKELPADVNSWDVTVAMVNGKRTPVLITDAGPIELTAEEYLYWQQNREKSTPFGRLVKGAKKTLTDAQIKAQQVARPRMY
jgi:hypothetical protein